MFEKLKWTKSQKMTNIYNDTWSACKLENNDISWDEIVAIINKQVQL